MHVGVPRLIGRVLEERGGRGVVVLPDGTEAGEYYSLYHHWPALRALYPFEAENSFDAQAHTAFAREHLLFPFFAVAIYLALVFHGQRFMAKREPFALRAPLAGWNLLLAAFSLYGALRTLPHLLATLALDGLQPSMCAVAEMQYGMGPSGLAVMLFSVASKVLELLDTAFLVLRKKPVTFIHWYHHTSVLVFTWVSYAEESSAGLWFCAVNFGVHSLMYWYYFLCAVHYKGVLRPPAPLVTTLQLAQMVMGVLLHARLMHLKGWLGAEAQPCAITDLCLASGLVVYGSYLYLFAKFAVERYLLGGGPKPPGAKAAKKQQ